MFIDVKNALAEVSMGAMVCRLSSYEEALVINRPGGVMYLKRLLIAMPVAMLVLGSGLACAEPINDSGAFACVADKWIETKREKGHKWIDYAGRCVGIPDTSGAPKFTENCVGNSSICPTRARRASRRSRPPFSREAWHH
jgi:hypothetical protein